MNPVQSFPLTSAQGVLVPSSCSPLTSCNLIKVAVDLLSNISKPESTLPCITMHSLGGNPKDLSVIYCKYLKIAPKGGLDTSCGYAPPSSKISAPTPKEERFEHVKDQFRENDVRCVSLALPVGKILHEPELASLVAQVIGSPPARDILNQVLQDGPLILLSADKRGAPMGASWETQERAIRILTTERPGRKLGHLLFELCNALNYKKLIDFLNKVKSGTVGKEAYVKQWELLEFDSGKRFTTAVQECISHHQWPQEADLDIPLVFLSGSTMIEWDEFWSLVKDSNHAEQYRTDWINNGIRKLYCKKNPRMPDCLRS